MNNPMALARKIAINREVNEACASWVAGAFHACWVSDGDFARLLHFLRLPAGARQAVAQRNLWLLIAAESLPEYQRAAALARAIADFMARCWPAWSASRMPPADASAFEQALFFAADSGAPMDVTRRQLRNILTGSR
jgi:hypothetical protein